jgi:small-conductance mechanosensitive channel
MDYALTVRIYGNTPLQWAAAVLLGTIAYVGLSAVRRNLVLRAERWGDRNNGALSRTSRNLAGATQYFFILALSLWAVDYTLFLPSALHDIVTAIIRIAVMAQFGLWGSALLNLWVDRYFLPEQDSDRASAAQVVKVLCLVTIWSTILLLTLGNFGIDITGLVAGLGIGGIAVAFALQSILKDLFASLAIILDKPFVVGDFIIFGDHLGSVERIGLKTTRVRSLWGEQISVSNDDLLNSRVRNYKRMTERRVSFNIRVTYEAPVEKLERIPGWIRDTIAALDGTRFDRSHIAAFEEWGPRIETVYYVLDPSYNVYMDIQQQINLTIARRFAEEDIAFAYPTRRLLGHGARDLDMDSSRPGAGTVEVL